MKTRIRMGRSVFSIVVLSALVILAACSSGGGSGSGPSTTSTAVVSSGTMTKGSVIVNGVRFTADAGATIRVDDNPGRPEAELRDGMQVKVKGQINDDRVTGRFEKVEAEPEVRGKLASLSTGSFTVTESGSQNYKPEDQWRYTIYWHLK